MKRFGYIWPYTLPLITLAALAYTFYPALSYMFEEWQKPEFSHSVFLPFLSFFLGWHLLAGKKIDAKPSWWGFVLVCAALGLFILGALSTFRHLSYIAIVLMVLGLVLSWYGVRAAKTAWMAFMPLLFAIPLPFMFYNPLSLQLQLLSSSIGATVIEFLGYSVYREGNVIDLGRYKLQVVDACNGLRYLFPILSFGFLLTCMVHDRIWKKALIFFSAIPVTIGINSLRIAVIGVTVNLWGQEAAEGFTHIFEGYLTFLICLAFLLGITVLLLRIPPAGSLRLEFLGLPEEKLFIRPVFTGTVGTAVTLAVLLTALVFGTGLVFSHHKPPALPSRVAELPLSLKGWQGTSGHLSPEILKELDLTDYFLADYTEQNAGVPPVNLYVAYYAQQELGAAIHSPSTCLPGGGWVIERADDITVEVHGERASFALPIKRLIIRDGDQQQVVYYWFKERDRHITGQMQAKWYLLVDSVLSGRSDGALLRLTTHIGPQETEEAADARLQAFLQAAFIYTERALP